MGKAALEIEEITLEHLAELAQRDVQHSMNLTEQDTTHAMEMKKRDDALRKAEAEIVQGRVSFAALRSVPTEPSTLNPQPSTLDHQP